MHVQFLQFSIVIVANDHNPTILNPDFLKMQKIVPDEWGWELANPPIATPPFATVQYKTGVSISVESNRLQVTDNKTSSPVESKVTQIVDRYIKVVPHVRYTSIGINFRQIIEMEQVDAFLKEHFLKEDIYSCDKNDLKSIGLKFVYHLDAGRLVLSLDSANAEKPVMGQIKKTPVINVNANFHRDLDIKKLPTSKQVTLYLKNVSEDWNRFKEIQSAKLGEEFN